MSNESLSAAPDALPSILVEQACIDASPCTVSFIIERRPAHLTTHFDRCDADTLRLALTLDDLAAHEAHFEPGTEITVTFASGANDYCYTSVVRSVGPSDDGAIHLCVAPPTQLTKVQRRKSFRIEVTPSDGWSIKVWKIDKYVLVRDKPPASAELKSELMDIGPGGLRMLVTATRQQALNLVEDQRFRIEITANKTSVLMEGKLRYPKSTGRDDVQAMCGVSFVNRASDIENRKNVQKLTAMLSDLERVIARRRAAA